MKTNLAAKLFFQIYIILYIILFSLSIGSFVLFRPFTYIDNDHSYVLCKSDNVRYELGPNYIFAVGEQLDPFNDAKARKLCEHKIIRDYNHSYPTPEKQNYTFLPAKFQDSSWLNAIFAFLITFFLGMGFIELFHFLFLKDFPSIGKNIWKFFLFLTE